MTTIICARCEKLAASRRLPDGTPLCGPCQGAAMERGELPHLPMSHAGLCPGCRAGEHLFCVRRADVDVSDDMTRTCACTCDPSTGDAAPSALELVKLRAPQPQDLARRFDPAALQLAPATTPTERQEIGTAIARFMLGAKDGHSADQAVRTIVAELGKLEAITVAETLANWALAIAAVADKDGAK